MEIPKWARLAIPSAALLVTGLACSVESSDNRIGSGILPEQKLNFNPAEYHVTGYFCLDRNDDNRCSAFEGDLPIIGQNIYFKVIYGKTKTISKPLFTDENGIATDVKPFEEVADVIDTGNGRVIISDNEIIPPPDLIKIKLTDGSVITVCRGPQGKIYDIFHEIHEFTYNDRNCADRLKEITNNGFKQRKNSHIADKGEIFNVAGVTS
ncbi:hypothetical protein A2954_02525 [Candidatus Roizmanbacteria bacterium RIFCSPLOWO2_01_FULL_37_12]|uniref:Uncharacterized protein n=1 Tax=Candidatus Roizmanbacteria bacterium RIFCSPLOWO2_01_FULL_37_12 TaxID=1802056 RepID=A0A1F7IEX2_9BACT|nr:MAG: hypothetical protein A3D76_00035 [Candidatus Roizmanbacteria bacterium RIFCSPHIGHO2_02_FULL_37_9b]OGK41901.1 MAG: hypothetical protein A2954_02525 [Candidatus Roizmanbacteria bacterium RIFCSPLOWO2_01_FULL_37_12]